MSLAIREICRLTASHRAKITGKDYSPLLESLDYEAVPAGEKQSRTVEMICSWFDAFERTINPRWDGSVA